jgi:hypothetical protein
MTILLRADGLPPSATGGGEEGNCSTPISNNRRAGTPIPSPLRDLQLALMRPRCVRAGGVSVVVEPDIDGVERSGIGNRRGYLWSGRFKSTDAREHYIAYIGGHAL